MHIHLKRISRIANEPLKTPMNDVGLQNTQKGSKTLPLSYLLCDGWAKRVTNDRPSAPRVSDCQCFKERQKHSREHTVPFGWFINSNHSITDKCMD